MTIKIEWEFEDDEFDRIVDMVLKKPTKLPEDLILKIAESTESNCKTLINCIILGSFLINSKASVDCINNFLRRVIDDDRFECMEGGINRAFSSSNKSYMLDDDNIIRLIKIDPNNINEINNPTEEMKDLYKVLTM